MSSRSELVWRDSPLWLHRSSDTLRNVVGSCSSRFHGVRIVSEVPEIVLCTKTPSMEEGNKCQIE